MDIETNASGFTMEDARNPMRIREELTQRADPLWISMDEEDFCDRVDDFVKDNRAFYKSKYNLYAQRKKNELYRFGRQIIDKEFRGQIKDYESRNFYNVQYEIQATIKPLAMSQLPDLLVTPGNTGDQSVATAKILSRAVDSDVKKRNNRQVLALAFMHRPVYRVGIIKAVWNPKLAGGLGDYEFIVVHPDLIELDHTATEANADKMKFISQLVNISVEDVIMMFPKARDRFADELKKDGIDIDDPKKKRKGMASKIDIRETWFTDYKKKEDDKYEKIEGVGWKYKTCMLGIMKNPNYDYVGDKQVFSYENPALESSKKAVTLQEMQASMVTGQFPPNVISKQIYHNYFTEPRKPYFCMVYDQWGKQPLDETTEFEQNLGNQQELDVRLKQISETLNNRGHHVWSKESGMKPEHIEKMDHNNPDEDYLVDGKVGEVHEFLPPERPTAQEFQDVERITNNMYSLAGANAVRGNLQSDTATSNQIAREGNYTRADDLVEDTINAAAEWMAGWALQFIKLRYTQEHFRKLLGTKGEVVFYRLHQNMIEDGMEVMIKASGTDKIKAQNNAQENARMQLTEPLSYFRDMGYEDAEERTAMLVAFQKDPLTYMTQFMEQTGAATPDLIAKLQALTPPPPPMGMPGQMVVPGSQPPIPAQGQPPVNPQQPVPGNTAQVPINPPQVPQGSPRAL